MAGKNRMKCCLATMMIWPTMLCGWCAAEEATEPSAGTPTPAQPTEDQAWRHFRVSAIIDMGDNLNVGLVDSRNNNNEMVAVGDTLFANVLCLSADYKKKTAVFDWAGSLVELSLTGASNLPAVSPTGTLESADQPRANPGDLMSIYREKQRRGEPVTKEDVAAFREFHRQEGLKRAAEMQKRISENPQLKLLNAEAEAAQSGGL